jgi:hypothetical protein
VRAVVRVRGVDLRAEVLPVARRHVMQRGSRRERQPPARLIDCFAGSQPGEGHPHQADGFAHGEQIADVVFGEIAHGCYDTVVKFTRRISWLALAATGIGLWAQEVVSDLDQRLAHWKTVKMPLDSSVLSARELALVKKLVEACHYLETIYWRQSDPDGLRLYQALNSSRDPLDWKLRRFLFINCGRFDLLDENRPFAGKEPVPPGRGFYPKGLTRDQIESFVKRRPDRRAEIYSPYTVVKRTPEGLQGVPYHVAYKTWLDPMAKALREAAALSDDPHFAEFLRLRADALLTDDYYASDLKWMDLQDPKIDIIFAPYETYLDDLLGVKGSYGAAVLIRNDAESRKLAVFQKYVPELQDALPLDPEDRPSKRGLRTPMEVMDTPFRSGDLRHGYQAVADNLPNDPRVHQEKGSKKIFFKNFMDARVNTIILPLAQRVMQADQAAKASGEGYLAGTLMHEIAHGLGPAYARRGGKQVDIRESIGPVSSALEEAKADVVGMFGLKWLIDHGALPKDRLEEYYASDVAGIFRTIRFSTAEAHGRAELMEFNYFSEQKAVTRDAATGRYVVDYSRMPAVYEQLAKELLTIEATGDRDRAEKWFARYGAIPPELKAALDASNDLPVDIDPAFSFPDTIE